MKIKGIPKLLSIVLLIGLVLISIDALRRDIACCLEEMLSFGKARSKMLLTNHMLKRSIEQWYSLPMSLYG